MELPMFYNEVEEWNRALLLYDAALKEINTKLEILNNEFKMAHQYNPIEHITSRVKSLPSIAKKIRRKNQELTVENIVKYVNDVAGIRIICSFASDIYRIADLITKQNDVKVLKVKDYIVAPKPNGYMSYHMIITIPIFLANDMVETKVEVQIRTIAMDFWASLEHKIYYKFEGNAPAHIREDLKECAQLVSYLDKKMLMINDEVRALEQGDYDEEEYQRKSRMSYFDSVKGYYGKLSEEEETEVIIEHETLPKEKTRPGGASEVSENNEEMEESEIEILGTVENVWSEMGGSKETSHLQETEALQKTELSQKAELSQRTEKTEEAAKWGKGAVMSEEGGQETEGMAVSETIKMPEDISMPKDISMPEDIGRPEDIGIERLGSLAFFLENRRKLRYARRETNPNVT